jgi:hypothetical protein
MNYVYLELPLPVYDRRSKAEPEDDNQNSVITIQAFGPDEQEEEKDKRFTI